MTHLERSIICPDYYLVGKSKGGGVRMTELRKGQQIGNFVVNSNIGYGGYAQVYDGKTLNGRKAVLKIIHEHLVGSNTGGVQNDVQSFVTGREIAKELGDGVNFPLFFDSGDQPRPYFIMELIPGDNLDKVLVCNPKLYFAEAIRIGHRCAEAYGVMHTKGIVHGDIKLDNIVYQRSKSLRVLDFDTAFKCRVVNCGGKGVLVPQDPIIHVVGTSPYFSPEALNCRLNNYSDVWGVGSIMYEILSGRAPFSGNDLFDLARKILTEEPVRLDIDPILEEMVMQCLRKDWNYRPDFKTLEIGLAGYMKEKGIMSLS